MKEQKFDFNSLLDDEKLKNLTKKNYLCFAFFNHIKLLTQSNLFVSEL